MNIFPKKTLLLLLGVGLSFLLSSPAYAQSRCNPASDPIGTVCYIEKPIGLRVGASDADAAIYNVSINPDAGYLFVNREEWVERSAFGSVIRPQVSFTSGGSSFDVVRDFDSYGESLQEIRIRYEQEVEGRFDGGPGRSAGGELRSLNDFLRREEQRYSNGRSSVTRGGSTTDLIEINASVRRRCILNSPFGCADYEGGSLQGSLRLYQIRLGTPTEHNQIISQGLNLLSQVEATRPVPLGERFDKPGNNGSVSCSTFCSAVRADGQPVWGGKVGINVGSETPSGAAGVCSCAASPAFFVKKGNNGTVTCDTFCRGSQWGEVGRCVGCFDNKNGTGQGCNYLPGFLEGPELTCSCVR